MPRSIPRPRFLAHLAIPVLLAAHATAQTQWDFRGWGTPRLYHAMAYDAARERVVLFGGDAGYYYGAIRHWEYDGTSWTSRNLAVQPPWLSGAMAYDSARQNVVLFGATWGWASGDTWTLDGTGWQKRTTGLNPSARWGHSMVFDSTRGNVVMFGGDDSETLNDMWQWDGSSWTQIANTPLPQKRSSASMAYDASRDRIVLFGGDDRSTSLSDTWEWDGTTWRQLFPASSPSQRWGAPMAYDEARRRVVLYGGQRGQLIYRQTWEWDGSDWTNRNAMGSPSQGLAMVYDSRRRLMVAYGGVYYGSTWEYAPRKPASYVPLGTGCPGTAGTPTLAPVERSLPWVGDQLDLEFTQIGATTVGILGSSASAWGALRLPFSLAVLGSSGCKLYTGAEIAIPLNNVGGTATWSLPIPNIAELAGLSFFVQGLEVGGPAIAVSDAGRVTMGLR